MDKVKGVSLGDLMHEVSGRNQKIVLRHMINYPNQQFSINHLRNTLGLAFVGLDKVMRSLLEKGIIRKEKNVFDSWVFGLNKDLK